MEYFVATEDGVDAFLQGLRDGRILSPQAFCEMVQKGFLVASLYSTKEHPANQYVSTLMGLGFNAGAVRRYVAGIAAPPTEKFDQVRSVVHAYLVEAVRVSRVLRSQAEGQPARKAAPDPNSN